MLSKWILPVNGDTGPRWRRSQSCWALFLVILAILGPFWAWAGPGRIRPIWAHLTPNAGRKHALWGERGPPKMSI